MLNTPVTRHTSSRLSKKVVRRMVILKEYANLPQHQPLLRTLLKRSFRYKIRFYQHSKKGQYNSNPVVSFIFSNSKGLNSMFIRIGHKKNTYYKTFKAR